LLLLMTFIRRRHVSWAGVRTLSLRRFLASRTVRLGALSRCLNLLLLCRLLALNHALTLDILEQFDAVLNLLLLEGERLDLLVHVVDLGFALEDLVASVACLHQLVVVEALRVVTEASSGPADQLLVHFLLEQD